VGVSRQPACIENVRGLLEGIMQQPPVMVLMLGFGIVVAGVLAFVARGRGGKFRGLPVWAGYWALSGVLLVALSRGPRWVSFPLLAILMFAALRTFYIIAPVRPKDRFAILAAYLSIPFVLYPPYVNAQMTFLIYVPLGIFLILPVLMTSGTDHSGLLDSAGRLISGAVFFLFFTAHLGLLAHDPAGRLELLGLLVLSVELPRRLAAGLGGGPGWLTGAIGLGIGAVLAMAVGGLLAPPARLAPGQGVAAAIAVTAAVAAGARVVSALAAELGMNQPTALIGRGAFLDQSAPGLFAAPVYYHLLEYLTRG